MLTLLRPVSLRRLAEHRLRTAMTTLGIALGVAVLVAVATVNRGIIGSFSETLDQISGKVHLEVKGGDTGLPEDLLDTVRKVPGVRAASVAIQRTLDVADTADGAGDQGKVTGEALAILAVNFIEDPKVLEHLYGLDRDQVGKRQAKAAAPTADEFEDPLAELDKARQVVVTSKFAKQHGKAKGDTVELMTPDGRQPFTIQAVVEPKGPQKAFGGNLAIMDYMDAQEVFGLERRVDRFDVAVQEPDKVGEIDRVAKALQQALGGKFEVEPPARRQQRQQQLLRSFNLGLTAGAGVALIVGMFLIYHTIAISVAQRRTEIGILRAAGATRRQIVRLFTLEGALFGLVGGLLGLGLGTLLARAMMDQAAGSISEIYVRVHVTDVQVPPGVLALGLAVGIGASAIAALIPAWRASRLSPVETIRTFAWDFQRPPGLGWTRREFTALAVLAVVPLVAMGPPVAGYPLFGLGAMGLVILAVTLLSRWVVLVAHRALGPALGQAFGLEGRLAADNLSRNASKAAVTVASLMVGLSMVMGTAIMTYSFRDSIDTWLKQSVPADLFVTAGATIGGTQNQPLAPDLGKEIEKIQGVEGVDLVRLRNVDYETAQILLLSLDVRIRFQRHTSWPITRFVGARDTVIGRMQRGEGVLISETFSHRFKKNPGDRVELPTATGRQSFPILGAIVDYSSDQGAIFMDRNLYMRFWQDDKVDTFEPYLLPGADAEAVRREILQRWGRQYRLFVLTNQEFRAEIGKMIDRIFSVTRALEFVTVFISIMSVINTLLTAILDRMREIGVLRAIGMLRRQLSRMIVVESFGLAVVGAVVGLGVGAINGYLVIDVVNRQDTGWQVPVQFPWHLAGIYAAVLIVVGTLAALYPSRVASRVPVVDALGYE